MKKKARGVLGLLLAVMFISSSGVLVWHQYHMHTAGEGHDLARDIVMQSVPEEIPGAVVELPEQPVPESEAPVPLEERAQFLLELDLEGLRRTNTDVLGWIHIPDSEIDYPIIQVRDNNEYLRRAWDGSPSQAGCIFLECRSSPELSDFNTIIYGHYMRNGTMFGSLHRFGEQEYLDAHPCIYFVTDDAVRRYEVFSAYEADVVSDTYRLLFEDETQKQMCLDYYISSSTAESPLIPTVEDRILTLSTCMGNGQYETRWVVQAMLTGEFAK